MAIYNLGQLQEPQAQQNPYLENLMKFGMQYELNKQQIQGQKDIANIDKATQAEIDAKKARQEQDKKDRSYFDTLIELGKDKLGAEEFGNRVTIDPGTKEVYRRWLAFHPEYKGIEPAKVIASISTKREVEEKYMKQAEEIKATIEAKKPLTPTQLGNAAWLADMVMRAPGGDLKAKKMQYQQIMQVLGEYQRRAIERMKAELQPTPVIPSPTQPGNMGNALYPSNTTTAELPKTVPEQVRFKVRLKGNR